MLDEVGIAGNIAGLFYRGVDPKDENVMRACEYAFKNLALHYVEKLWPNVLPHVRFDDVKLQMMLGRFYRDAWGVSRFRVELARICPDKEMRAAILKEMDQLSIRINSHGRKQDLGENRRVTL